MQRQSQQRFLLFIYAFFSYTGIDGFSLSFVSFQSELRELRRTTRTTNEEELVLQHRHEHHRNSFTVLSISKDNYYDDFAGYGDNKEEENQTGNKNTELETGNNIASIFKRRVTTKATKEKKNSYQCKRPTHASRNSASE